jgi:hypothetical protein
MCKLNNIKDKTFIIYRIVNENYVGVTTNLHKRLLKHKNRSGFDISDVSILFECDNLEEALTSEFYFQDFFKCTIGVRNQEGSKNPLARQVLDLKHGIFYDTIKDACEALNYNYSNVRHRIKNNDNKYLLIRL